MTPMPAAANMSNEQGDKELFSEVLRAQTKSFYIDLKENSRGRYVKIAEKGRYRPKSSIVIPSSGLPQIMHVLRTFISGDGSSCRQAQPRDVIVESKVFSFSAGSNERGQYLRVYESGGGYPSGGSSLMIPCGWANAYLKLFYESLEKIARQLSQDGSTGFDFEQALAAASDLAPAPAADAVVLDAKEGGPVLSVGSKHFFFELRANDRGHYLKVKEVSGSMKQLLVIPSKAIAKFQEAIALAVMLQPRLDHHNDHGSSSAGHSSASTSGSQVHTGLPASMMHSNSSNGYLGDQQQQPAVSF